MLQFEADIAGTNMQYQEIKFEEPRNKRALVEEALPEISVKKKANVIILDKPVLMADGPNKSRLCKFTRFDENNKAVALEYFDGGQNETIKMDHIVTARKEVIYYVGSKIRIKESSKFYPLRPGTVETVLAKGKRRVLFDDGVTKIIEINKIELEKYEDMGEQFNTPRYCEDFN
uniref:DUF4115 domain-containing protein n=1 Tax=Rhabditophanes sp. KR3021 TaxID=114890 RepID=A0AC35TYW4_9BILA